MNGKAKNMKWFACILLLLAVTCTVMAGPRDDLWAQVYQMISKGLPQSAITILEQIIPDANDEQAVQNMLATLDKALR